MFLRAARLGNRSRAGRLRQNSAEVLKRNEVTLMMFLRAARLGNRSQAGRLSQNRQLYKKKAEMVGVLEGRDGYAVQTRTQRAGGSG